MIEATAKVLIGTAFYVGLLWVAQRNPRAAGMMLTFPTLNGLVLLMASPAAREEAAGAMLLMPLVNVAMWTFYLACLGPLLDRHVRAALASAILIAIGTAFWLAFAALITARQWGVPAGLQWYYSIAVLAGGALLTLVLPRRSQAAAGAAKPQTVLVLARSYQARIAVFALTLAAIALMDGLGASAALLGAVAGAPVVAMFGVQTLASDASTPLDIRRRTLAQMGDGQWLGPAIACIFVACYWRALDVLAGQVTGLAYHAAGAALLIAGWGLCLLVIWLASQMLQQRPAPATPPRSP